MVTSILRRTTRYASAKAPDNQWAAIATPLGFKAGDTNLYRYVGNSPPNGRDPSGLKVEGTYDVKTHTLTLKDVDTGEVITVTNMFSGNNSDAGEHANKPESDHIPNHGPLPRGDYLLGHGFVKKDHPGDNYWFRLYGPDGKGGYSFTDIPVKDPKTGRTIYRGQFYLHVGSASDGCLTVRSDINDKKDRRYPTGKDFDRLREFLKKTKPFEYKKGDTYLGTFTVK